MEVAEVLDHPCPVDWNILVVAFVEVRCQSSQVPYSRPCQPNLALRLEYLAYQQVADEFDQRLVDPARIGQVLAPSAVELGAVTLNAVLEGHHSDLIRDYLYCRDEN